MTSILIYTLYLIIFGTWYYLKFRYMRNTDNEKSNAKTFFKSKAVIFTLFLGIALQILSSSIIYFVNELFPKAFEEYGKIVESLTGDLSITDIIPLLILAPIAEEIMFRGLLLRYALKIMPVHLAVIFQAIGFGIFHGNMVQFIYATIIGIILGYLAYYMKSVLPSVFLHFMINLSGVLLPANLFETRLKTAVLLGVSAVVTLTSIILIIHWYKCKLSHQGQ